MFRLSVTPMDPVRLKEIQAVLDGIPRGLQKALARAINKVAVSLRYRLIKFVASRTDLRQKIVRRAFRLRRASWGLLEALIRIRSGPIPLLAFGARQKATGVSIRSPIPVATGAVERGRGEKGFIPHAFIARMPQGHQGVFIRQGPKRRMRSGRYAGKMRQPIRELFGPSILEIAEWDQRSWQSWMDQAGADLEAELDRQVEVLIGRTALTAVTMPRRLEGPVGEALAYVGRLEASVQNLKPRTAA